MNWFLRRLLNLDAALVDLQREVIVSQQAEFVRADLEHARNVRNLIEQFLVALETPEIDIRNDLMQGLSDLKDHVARLEEHAPS